MLNDEHSPAWVRDAIFYEIFPERFANGDPANDPPGVAPWDSAPTRDNFFGGDLQGILDRLPYLEDLGVTALYLTPIFAALTNHKYDCSDYLKIDPAFGDEALLRRLVEAAHRRGIRVVLDAVFNHCGDGFWAFEDLLRRGPASPYAGWFYPRRFPLTRQPLAYQTCGGAEYLPKLNVSNPEVRSYLLKVARYWIERCDIDGWRLDVPWKVPMDFWRELRQVVKAAKPEAYLAAETWRDTAHWLQGDTCDGTMNYPLRDYILDYCVRDSMDAEDFNYFTSRLRQVHGPADAFQLNLLGSHDTPRLRTLCAKSTPRLQLAVAAQFTLPGAPMIYYGDEVGLLGENDPGCRAAMPWAPEAWDEPIHSAYRNLIRIRREHPALSRAPVETLLAFNGVYAFRRCLDDDEVIVVLNPRGEQQDLTIPLPAGAPTGPRRDLLTGKTVSPVPGGLHLPVLPSETALILSRL